MSYLSHGLGTALLAVVVATALVWAGEVRAGLLDGSVTCTAIGTQRACLPTEKDIFDPVPYTVSDTGVGGDAIFTISADEDTIVLTFTEFVTGNALNTTGFRLEGLQSIPDLVPGALDVTFLGDWGVNDEDIPVSRPEVSNDLSSIEWTTLAGGDPSTGAIARINLNFVPEPSTGALTALGLIGLAARRRRP